MSLKKETQQTKPENKEDVRWLSPTEMRTWLTFWGAMHVVDTALDHDLQTNSGLSHHDYQILAMLSKAPNQQLRMAELADIVFGSRSRLTYQVTQLERAGLIRRESCLTDKRGSVAILTSQGYRLLQAAAPGHLAGIRRVFFDQLTPEQVTVLGDALEAIIAAMGGSTALETALSRELHSEQEILQ